MLSGALGPSRWALKPPPTNYTTDSPIICHHLSAVGPKKLPSLSLLKTTIIYSPLLVMIVFDTVDISQLRPSFYRSFRLAIWADLKFETITTFCMMTTFCNLCREGSLWSNDLTRQFQRINFPRGLKFCQVASSLNKDPLFPPRVSQSHHTSQSHADLNLIAASHETKTAYNIHFFLLQELDVCMVNNPGIVF